MDVAKEREDEQGVDAVEGGHYEGVFTVTKGISEFGLRSRELGRQVQRWELEWSRIPVEPEHRQLLLDWIRDARNHTPDPDAFDTELVEDREMDYLMLARVYRALSDLVRDRD